MNGALELRLELAYRVHVGRLVDLYDWLALLQLLVAAGVDLGYAAR